MSLLKWRYWTSCPKECCAPAMKLLKKMKENGNMKTMKKLWMAVTCTAAFVLASCQEESFEGRDGSDNYYASVETFGNGTKTALGEGRSIVWLSEDRIAVFEGNGAGQAYQVLDAYVGKSSGEFAEVEGLVAEGTGAGIEGTIAVYPFNEDLSVTSGNNGDYIIEGISFPSEQKYIAGSFSDEAFPMTAICEQGNKSLSFRNIGGVLKLSLTGNNSVSQITLTGNSGEPLSGPATVTLGSDGIPSVTMSDDASTSVTLVCDPAVQLDPETATDFYISIPPTEFEAGFSVTVTEGEGRKYYRTTTISNTVKRSEILAMPELTQEDLELLDLKLIYTDAYIVNSNSFLFNDGNFAIFTPDSLSGYSLYIDYIDLQSGELSDNDGIAIQCDSLMRPLYFVHNDIKYYYEYSDGTFDLTIIQNNSQDTYIDIEYNEPVQTKGSTEGLTNLDKAGWTFDMVGLALSYKDGGKTQLLKELNKFITQKVAGWKLNPIIEDLLNLGLNVAEAYTEKGKLPIIGGILTYADLLQECAAFTTKRYIGDVTPTLESVKQKSGSSVVVRYLIEGYDPNRGNPYATVHYKKNGESWRQGNTRMIGGDIYYDEVVTGLSAGKYDFRIIVYPYMFISHPLLQQYYGFKTRIISLELKEPDCTTGGASSITTTSAVVECTYSNVPEDGQCQVMLSWDDGHRVINAENREGTQSITLSGLKPNTTYSYCASIDYEGGPVNGEMKEFTTKGDNERWVDLGLSVLWAAYNVGASSPEEYGGYYAWGETSTKSDYTWENYIYREKYYYDDDWYWVGKFIGNEISGTSYDVAHVQWGGGARMPTLAEVEELVDNCTFTGGSYNGVEGSYVTGPNGNSIFLPFAGNRDFDGLGYEGDYGYFWSGTYYDGYYGIGAYNACYLFCSRDYGHWYDYDRGVGLSVRPVTEK